MVAQLLLWFFPRFKSLPNLPFNSKIGHLPDDVDRSGKQRDNLHGQKKTFSFWVHFCFTVVGREREKKEKFYFKEFETKVKLWRRKRRSRMGWCRLLTGGIAPF
jgi:hypothetical protein